MINSGRGSVRRREKGERGITERLMKGRWERDESGVESREI